MWLNKCFKIPKLSLRDFILKSIVIVYTLPQIFVAQTKVAFKQFTDISLDGIGINVNNNKIIYSVTGDVAADSNKSYNLNVCFNSSFDTLSTNLFYLSNNVSGTGFGLVPFTNTSNKLFYWGAGGNYASLPNIGFTYVFGNANQNDYSLISHKAYRSKYYNRPNYSNTFLNDSTFISTHWFKWYHPSSLPYGAGIWWFNKNMDTLQQKVYFEASGNTDLLPISSYPLPGKDILISGFTDTLNVYNFDAFLMRLDSAGNVKYARSIGTSEHENMYLTKIFNQYYFIGSSSKDYNVNSNSNIYLAKVDIETGNIGKTFKIIKDSLGLTLMHDPSVQRGKIYLPLIANTKSVGPYKLKSCYLLIDTNGVISKQYLHSQSSNGYLNSYTMPIVTDSLKNVFGSIMSYNSNSDPFYIKLFKLDSNLVGCYPSDTPFSFTTTIATGELHSLPMNIITAKDSIFEVTIAGAILQGHGFNTMADECIGYVGIEEHTIQNQFIKLYPNPTTNQLQIETEEDITYLKVYNQLGKEVTYKLLTEKNIDVSGLSIGLYILEIKTGNGFIRQKFIKE